MPPTARPLDRRTLPCFGAHPDVPRCAAVMDRTNPRRPAGTLPRMVWPLINLEKRTKGRHMGIALAVGDKAPPFNLPRDNGEKASLADYKGRKLVLYFYPRADTPGCTREAIDFSRLRAEFKKAGTDILGVSADPVKAQHAFKKKHDLTIALLS